MAIKNFYAILGVGSTASAEEIKLAYRKLAKKFHPDKNPGDRVIEERFKEITEAYNTLSDEEGRSKYDLKFFYTTNARSEKKYSTGSANERPKYRAKKERADTAAEKRTTRIIFAVVIAFVLIITVMIIIDPDDSESNQVKLMMSQLDQTPPEKIKDERPPPIMDADSPYDKIFGEGVSVAESNNTITMINVDGCEVVACLVEYGAHGRTIRNEYFGAGLTYRIVGIPNGTYYIKAYFGKHWNPEKKMAGGSVKGGFDEELGFFRSDKKKNLFEVSQHYAGENLTYSNFEIELKKIFSDKTRQISAEEFFK